jgi:hypothetical protein
VGNEIFLEFEGNEEVDPEEKKAIKKSKNPPRTMSEASMAIYGHVNALADQSVSSSEIASSEDLKKFNHLIKTETKKDIRQSTIARREADKNEIAIGIKNHLNNQEQQQTFQQLMQLQSLKMMQKLLAEDENDDSNLKEEVEKSRIDIESLKSDMLELKSGVSNILALLQNQQK